MKRSCFLLLLTLLLAVAPGITAASQPPQTGQSSCFNTLGGPIPCTDAVAINQDGAVNFDDINPFVLLLAEPGIWQSEYPNCNPLNGDCNQDGLVNFDDIDAFVRLLSGAA